MATSTLKVDDPLRYGFGKNWAEFVDQRFSDARVEAARKHMSEFLRVESLAGKVFLDIGCGSGIHSLAAIRMGAAQVIGFDYDADSVATTLRVRESAGLPTRWAVTQASVLDPAFMATLPKVDIVYSWGVLHHTGDMWSAVRNAAIPLKDDGVFYVALYSSDNYVDPPPQYWLDVKRAYNQAGRFGKRIMEWRYFLQFNFLPELKARRNPIASIRKYGKRGMSYWTDVKDWLGGWPMDFASLAQTQDFCSKQLGLTLVNVLTGEGCTEYLVCRPSLNAQWRAIVEARTLNPLAGPFQPDGGKSYSCVLRPGSRPARTASKRRRRSRLMAYEDGRMLGRLTACTTTSRSMEADASRIGAHLCGSLHRTARTRISMIEPIPIAKTFESRRGLTGRECSGLAVRLADRELN